MIPDIIPEMILRAVRRRDMCGWRLDGPTGDGDIVFAAGLGMDVRRLDEPETAPERVRFRYRPVQDLWKTKAIANYGDLPENVRRERESLVKAAQGAQRRMEAFLDAQRGRSGQSGTQG